VSIGEGAPPRVHVGHFKVFQRGLVGGNPCPVVIDPVELPTGAMQRLAAHFGEESGFVSHDEDGGVRFRFFMPGREVPMCVHATVAAITALVRDGRLPDHGDLAVRTASGCCGVSWVGRSPIRVTVEQQPPRVGEPADVAGVLERALRLEPGSVDPDQQVRPVSVSTPKLIVPLRTTADVHRADPDFDVLWSLCEALETTGAYVFAPHHDEDPAHFVARQFPVGGGVKEDAATGVAAGALAAYVADRARPSAPRWIAVRIDQGDAMGRPCRLEAAAYAGPEAVLRTTVTGSALLEREESVDLSAFAQSATGTPSNRERP
jgi:trans-2,3-dihydro-3-hydroxyanthranilate isomerase